MTPIGFYAPIRVHNPDASAACGEEAYPAHGYVLWSGKVRETYELGPLWSGKMKR